MKRGRRWIRGVLAAMLAVGGPASALDFEPGEYEITSTMEVPGMAMAMPPQTMRHCMTKEEPVPPSSGEESGQCKMGEVKIEGDTVTWNVVCEQEGYRSVTRGETTYHGDRFEGTITSDTQAPSGNMSVTVRISGKRVGACR